MKKKKKKKKNDIMEILEQGKVKRCKDRMKCDQKNKWKQ